MLSLIRFAMVIVLLAGWGLAAMSLHVIRTANGVQLIPKNELSATDTYVDVRQWSSDDESKHPVLLARLQQLDRTQLLDATAPRGDVTPVKAQSAQYEPDLSSDLSRAWAHANAAYSRGR